jgi:hypothetical protein
MSHQNSLAGFINTCRAKKIDGSACRNRIPVGGEFCYHHSNGFWNKFRYLHRNQRTGFWIGAGGLGLTILFGLVGLYQALHPRIDHSSRVDITDIRALDLVSQKYPNPGLSFNVFYANHGNVGARKLTHRCVVTSSDHILSAEEGAKWIAMANDIQPSLDDASEIQPGDTPKHYFSCPTDDDDIALLGTQKAAVLAGRTRLYMFITSKSRNDRLASDKVEVTEFCGYFFQSLEAWHNCDNNQSYLQSVPVN